MMSPETSMSAQALAGHLITSLSEPERQILMSVAALSDVSVRTEHLAGMTGLSNSEPILDSLAQRAVIRAENGGYRLDATLTQELQQQPERLLIRGRAYYGLAESTRRPIVASESDVLDRVLTALLRRSVGASAAPNVDRRCVGKGGAGARDRVLRIDLVRRSPSGRPARPELHQIGTRAVPGTNARSSFIMALRLRESSTTLRCSSAHC
jgi:hypothetical protein